MRDEKLLDGKIKAYKEIFQFISFVKAKAEELFGFVHEYAQSPVTRESLHMDMNEISARIESEIYKKRNEIEQKNGH